MEDLLTMLKRQRCYYRTLCLIDGHPSLLYDLDALERLIRCMEGKAFEVRK